MNRETFLRVAATYGAGLGSPNHLLSALEARYGGRLGVVGVNSATGARIVHRANERFAMCSTFKVLLVGAVLARVDARREQIDRREFFSQPDLLEYAPVTRANVGRGFMTVESLCEAAIEYSDNTAANLLLRTVGGPAGVTRFARSLGDARTRLDRREPDLNTASPGDARDTTTPAAMATSLAKIISGSALHTLSHRKLSAWMMNCKTGRNCIRAGVPASWRVGDKTGAGAHATRNDIAVLSPPNRPMIVVTAYYTGSRANADARDEVLARVGRIVSSALG